MFETETMAELCIKQGLVREALAIYRRLLAAAADTRTRERRARRIAELDRQAAASLPIARRPAAVTAVASFAPPAAAIQALRDGDGRAVTLEWRLPDDVRAPALQILVLRRQPDGIATERRTVPV